MRATPRRYGRASSSSSNSGNATSGARPLRRAASTRTVSVDDAAIRATVRDHTGRMHTSV